MATFLVRVSPHTGLGNARELVGIVSADTSAQLFDIVDEFGDADNFQYLMLPPGMIYARQNAPIIPDQNEGSEDSDDDAPDFWSGASLSEVWSTTFLGLEGERSSADAWLALSDLAFIDGDVQ